MKINKLYRNRLLEWISVNWFRFLLDLLGLGSSNFQLPAASNAALLYTQKVLDKLS